MSLASSLIKCISKPPSERRSKDIDLAFEWFKKYSDFFDDSETENLRELIKYCAFAVATRDDVIVKQHDIADSLFMLISGSVSIYDSTQSHRIGGSVASQRSRFWNTIDDSDPPKASSNSDLSPNAAGGPLDRSRFGKFVGTIGPGQGFGEYDLLQAETTRNASFIADESCRLIVVDRELYDSCLRPFRGLQLSARQKFVHQCHLFAGWPRGYVEMATMSLKPKTASFGMNIMEQGETVDGLIFLASGEVKLLMNPSLHVAQYPQIDLEPCKRTKEDARPYGTKEWQTGAKTMRTRSQNDMYQSFRTSTSNLEVSLVGPGEIVGELEYVLGLSTYVQTAVSTTQTDYFTMNARNLERLLAIKRDSSAFGILHDRVEERILGRCLDPSFPSIPLMQYFAKEILRRRKIEADSSTRAMLNQEINKMRSNSRFSFILPWGPVVDQFGPGSAFYHTRMIRKLRASAPKAKQEGHPKNPREQDARNPTRSSYHTDVQPPSRSATIRHSRKAFDKSHANSEVPQHLYVNDWETGSSYLNDLEKRMEIWLEKTGSLRPSSSGEKLMITPLKRSSDALFENPHGIRRVLPGVPVLQHRKMLAEKVESHLMEKKEVCGNPVDPFTKSPLVRSQVMRAKSACTYKDLSFRSRSAAAGRKSTSTKFERYTLEEYRDLRTELREREKEVEYFGKY